MPNQLHLVARHSRQENLEYAKITDFKKENNLIQVRLHRIYNWR